MLSAYRRFYLYSALSISLVAGAVALGATLALLLRAFGLGLGPLTDDDVRLSLSQAAALLLFAVPIGLVHLRIINGSLGDPAERVANVRHFYLNLWILVALVTILAAATDLANRTFATGATGDRSITTAAIVVAVIVGVVGWRWRRMTRAPAPRWELDAAFGAMAIAMLAAVFQVGGMAQGLGALAMSSPTPFRPPFYDENAVRTGASGLAVALAVWAIAARWAWRHRTAEIRISYLTLGYAIGVLFLALGAILAIQSADLASRGKSLGNPAGAWPPMAIGILLVGIHGGALLLDRGRNGRGPAATDRLLVGLPALVGLASLIGGVVLVWTFVVDHSLMTFWGADDARDHFGGALGPLIVGVVAYPLAWWAFLRRSDAVSAVRRFIVFTVVCLSLVGTVVTGAFGVFSLFSYLTGASNAQGHLHGFVTYVAPAVLFAAVFGAYLLMYVRDQRSHRETARAAPVAAADPLMTLLEDVAAGRMRPADAAARVRALAR